MASQESQSVSQPAKKVKLNLSECHKKYIIDEQSLLSSNKFFLPRQLEEEISMEQDTVNNQPSTQKVRIPPIFLHNVNKYQTIHADLKSITVNEFTTQHRSDGLKINLTSIEDFRAVTKFYDLEKVQYHSYRDPEKAVLEVIMRNVPISITTEEILNELKSKYPVSKVTRLLSKKKETLPLCAIELIKNEQSQLIYKLDKFMNCIVLVEPRRRSIEIPQCTKCQRYGHTKNYCRLDARCVKCDGTHHYTACNKPRDAPVKCVNCGGPHSANYRACPYYQSIKNRKDSQNSSSNNQRTATQRPEITSYAGRTAINPNIENSTNQSVNDNSAFMDVIIRKITELVQPLLTQLKKMFTNFITNLLNQNLQ